MKNSKQTLNEIDISTVFWIWTGVKLVAGGVALVIIRKVMKRWGSRYKNIGEFFKVLRNPKKLKEANVSDDEMRALYSNGGEALTELGSVFGKEVLKKVAAGKLTPDVAIKQLEGIILKGDTDAWLKKLNVLYSGSGKVASTASKGIYTKIIGSALSKSEIKDAATKVYGVVDGPAKSDYLYKLYLDQLKSGKLAIPFKNKSTFPSIDEWTAITGWTPKNPNLGFNDRLIKQKNIYNWHKFIWTLYR